MRITIRDIADRAGVSKTTVSFAFNDPRKISKATYERIMAIASDLGYVPDPVARTLTTKRTGSIGLLLPQPMREALLNPYAAELLQGIGAACHENDGSLLIVPPVKGRLVEAARRAAVDGLIAVGVGPDHSIVDLVKKRHIPLLIIDGSPDSATATVGIDDESAAAELMRYVLGLGHRRVAVVELEAESYNEPEERSSLVRDRRMRGFETAFAEYGLDPRGPGVKFYSAPCSIRGGMDACAGILADGAPSAVVAMADIVAVGILSACRERGVAVPGGLCVVSFDDIELSRHLSPPLTTVRQPGFDKGYEAGRILFGMLNERPAERLVMPYELIVRASAAPPAYEA